MPTAWTSGLEVYLSHQLDCAPSSSHSPLGPQHRATTSQPARHIMPAHFLHLQGDRGFRKVARGLSHQRLLRQVTQTLSEWPSPQRKGPDLRAD